MVSPVHARARSKALNGTGSRGPAPRVRGRDRLTTWDGHVELSAGRIRRRRDVRDGEPGKGIRERSARASPGSRTRPATTTALDVTDRRAGGRRASVSLAGDSASDEAERARATADTLTFPAGGVDLRVFAARLARTRARQRARVRAHRPLAHARPVSSVLDPGDSGGRRAGLDEPGLPRRLRATSPLKVPLRTFPESLANSRKWPFFVRSRLAICH